jgi:hypothetical protein
MLVNIMVAAMPHFPALPQEPGRDFTPVSLKGQSGDGGSSAQYANICASAIIVQVLQAFAAEPYSANPFVCADLTVCRFRPRAPEAGFFYPDVRRGTGTTTA